MSWYMFFFQLPFLPEIFLKHDDFAIVDLFFNKQHLPDVSRQVSHSPVLKLIKLIVTFQKNDHPNYTVLKLILFR